MTVRSCLVVVLACAVLAPSGAHAGAPQPAAGRGTTAAAVDGDRVWAAGAPATVALRDAGAPATQPQTLARALARDLVAAEREADDDPGARAALVAGAFSTAMRRHVDALAGTRTPDPSVWVAPTSRSAGVGEPAAGSSAAEPTPVHGVLTTGEATAPGDLTGDGLADLVVVRPRWPEEGVALTGHAGTDGRALWTSPLAPGEPAHVSPAGDLTGDGIDDLLHWSLQVDDEEEQGCDDGGCRSERRYAYRWHLGVRSGADGALAWQLTHPGTYRVVLESRQGVQWRSSYEITLTDGLLLPELVDGDLLVHRHSFTMTGSMGGLDLAAAWTSEVDEAFRGRTIAQVVHGRDGSTRQQLASVEGPGLGRLEPFGAGGDLLWSELRWPDSRASCVGVLLLAAQCTDPPESGATLVAARLDGATLAPRWRWEQDGLAGAFVAALGADVDGDGTPDVAIHTDRGTFDETALALVLVDGAGGVSLWRSEGRWGFPRVMPSLDGGAGADLLLLTGRAVWGASSPPTGEQRRTEVEAVAERLDGATGDVLDVGRRSLATDDIVPVSIGLDHGGDADGDGIGDVVLACSLWLADGPVTDGAVESGRTADVLLWLPTDGAHTLVPAGDLDGDRLEDGLVQEREDGYGSPAGSRAVRIIDGGELWRAGTGAHSPLPDLDGDGAADVLRTTWATGDGGRLHTTFAVLRGADGSERYTIDP